MNSSRGRCFDRLPVHEVPDTVACSANPKGSSQREPKGPAGLSMRGRFIPFQAHYILIQK
jgi:hypothetical protein